MGGGAKHVDMGVAGHLVEGGALHVGEGDGEDEARLPRPQHKLPVRLVVGEAVGDEREPVAQPRRRQLAAAGRPAEASVERVGEPVPPLAQLLQRPADSPHAGARRLRRGAVACARGRGEAGVDAILPVAPAARCAGEDPTGTGTGTGTLSGRRLRDELRASLLGGAHRLLGEHRLARQERRRRAQVAAQPRVGRELLLQRAHLPLHIGQGGGAYAPTGSGRSTQREAAAA